MVRTPRSSRFLGARSFRIAAVVGAATIAAATATGVVLAAQLGARSQARHEQVAPEAVPSAGEVATELAGAANAYSMAIENGIRIEHASCLQGDPGSYVCSFVRVSPTGAGVCSVALLTWTPNGDSTFTVGTAGRVALPAASCGPVKKVLHVLGASG